MIIRDWNIEALTGYKPKTTFYRDLSIADRFGLAAIKDTYKRVFKEFKDNTEYFTEFVMALNWKINEHYETNDNYAKLYNDLWIEADNFVYNNWSEEQLHYYFKITD